MARMVAANEVPETVVMDSTVGALGTRRWAKEGHARLTTEERRKIFFEKLGALRSQILDGGEQESSKLVG